MVRRTRSPRGLTLIELEVTLVVLTILAVLTVYGFTAVYGHARDGRAHDVLAHVTAAQQALYTSRGVFVVVEPATPDDDTAVQAVAEHEAGYAPADAADLGELVVSIGRGTNTGGVPYVAVATTLGDTCALRVAYPTRSGLEAVTDTQDVSSVMCNADHAATALAG